MLQNTKKIYFRFTYASSEVHFRSTESQTFYWSIMTADDSIKCRCANSGMTGQVGGFQNPGVCLQAFPSLLPHPLPALLLTPFSARSLTLVPRSLLLNGTETLATQADKKWVPELWRFWFFLLQNTVCIEMLLFQGLGCVTTVTLWLSFWRLLLMSRAVTERIVT